MSIQKRAHWIETIDGVLHDEDVDIYTSAKAVLYEDGSNLEDNLPNYASGEIVGKLEDLTTEDKSNLANAIDEVQVKNENHLEVALDISERLKGYDNKLEKITKSEDISVSTLPSNWYGSGDGYGCVLLNGEIHLLGFAENGYHTGHYKYNGDTWEYVSTLPYRYADTETVVYDNEIHIMGGQYGYKNHFKWNGTTWESVSTLPASFGLGSVVVLDNKIHYIGGNECSSGSWRKSQEYYIYDGLSWTKGASINYSFYCGEAVVYNDEIHLLGSGASTSVYKYHYKYNGTSWVSVSTLPYNFYRGSAVVYNNEIYIMGSMETDCRQYHYKFNGGSWESVRTLPFDFYDGGAIVYNNEIHILGGRGNAVAHYSIVQLPKIYGYCKTNHIIELTTPSTPLTDNLQAIDEGYRVTKGGYVEIEVEDINGVVDSDDGDESVAKGLNKVFWLEKGNLEWVNTEVSTLPYRSPSSAVVYNNEIHILGNYTNPASHYKYNGLSWESVSTLPHDRPSINAVVLDNEIHILGGYYAGSTYEYHYKFNGTSWESVSTLPYGFSNGGCVVYNDEIHILGNYSSSYYKHHYKYNGSTWASVSTLPYNFYNGCVVVYDNEIHILGGGDSGSNSVASMKYHYKYNGSTWKSVSTLPNNVCYSSAVVLNNEIHILGARADGSNYKYHNKYNGSSWVSVTTLPYEFSLGCAVVYQGAIHILGNISELTTYNKCHYTLNTPAKISGYCKQNYTIYLPISSTPLTDNLTPTDEGYLVTDSGYVEIAVG